MIALQNLNSTNKQLTETQNRINTGSAVSGPKMTAPYSRSPSRCVRRCFVGVGEKTSLDRAAKRDRRCSCPPPIDYSDLLTENEGESLAASDGRSTKTRAMPTTPTLRSARPNLNIVSKATFNGVNLIDARPTRCRRCERGRRLRSDVTARACRSADRHLGRHNRHDLERERSSAMITTVENSLNALNWPWPSSHGQQKLASTKTS